MSEEKKHHNPFHRHKEEKPAGEMTKQDYEKQIKHHKHLEKASKLGTVAAIATARHEKHKAKKDPENAHEHKIKEEIAATVAVGSVGFAIHEHHQKKEAKKEKETAFGKKHHPF